MLRKLFLLLFVFVCAPVLAVEPTLVANSATAFTAIASGAAKTTASFTWQTGDRMLVFGGTEENLHTFATPTTAGANLTFSQITALGGASNSEAYLWEGVATGAGTGTITATMTGGSSVACGLLALQYRGSSARGTPVTQTGGTGKTASITRAAANSHVAFWMVDFNAVGEVVVDPTPAGGTQRLATNIAGRSDFFGFTWGDQGATGTTSYGITNHTGTVDAQIIAVEVQGTGGGSSTVVSPIGGGGGSAARPVTARRAANDDEFLLRASR